jgi:NADH-quinone oxidoreductase subunit C/D
MADDVPVTSAPGAKYDVVRELYERFGQDTFVFQSTLDDVPTLWVPRAKLVEVLRFLRHLPASLRDAVDLSASTSACAHRQGLPADFTVFYHLLSIERNSDVRIKVALKAATCIAADGYPHLAERQLV